MRTRFVFSAAERGDMSAARSPYYSLGLAALAALILLLTRLTGALVRPEQQAAVCDPPPPFIVSLPESATPPAASATPPAARSGTRSPTPAATSRASATPTPAALPPLQRLLRGDDPPANHDLRLVSGPAMPLVIPPPCQVPVDQRRRAPCVQ